MSLSTKIKSAKKTNHNVENKVEMLPCSMAVRHAYKVVNRFAQISQSISSLIAIKLHLKANKWQNNSSSGLIGI